MNAPGVMFRPWQSSDGDRMAGLLDVDAGALWINQFHSLHGGPVDSPGWRQTVVAVLDRDQAFIVGAGTAAINRVHPGRYTAAVEVAPNFRRRGIGTDLAHELRRLRPEQRPLAGKVIMSSGPPRAFVAHVGGRVYQRCRGVIVDPSSLEVRDWIADVPPPSRWQVTDLLGLSSGELAAAFASQYRWVHQPWAPVGDGATLEHVSRQVGADLDRRMSTGVWVGGGLVAVVFAFADADDPVEVVEVVAETVNRDCAEGIEIVRSAVSRTLRVAAGAGASRVAFDGHESDPHLDPVVRSLPSFDVAPVDLVEWP